VLIVREDTLIKGTVSNCSQADVFGRIEGEIAAGKLVVHKGGSFSGQAKLDNAEIHGVLQGEAVIKNLIKIMSSGDVSGNVQYGRMALENGGSLAAEVRNVPPRVSGDLEISVEQGRAARVTLEDLTAIDPDDKPENLTFSISNARNGFVYLFGTTPEPIARFTQADIEAGRVLFMHKGADTSPAGFDVVVADKSGASSGAAQSVRVSVRAQR